MRAGSGQARARLGPGSGQIFNIRAGPGLTWPGRAEQKILRAGNFGPVDNSTAEYSSAYEGSYLAANSNGRKFLYNSKCLDVIILLVKYYVPLEHFNKVIKLLKFKLCGVCIPHRI